MNGPLKAAWVLTAFVIVAGAVLWGITGHAAFAVFIGLGLLTAAGAWFTGRTEGGTRRKAAPTTRANKEEAP